MKKICQAGGKGYRFRKSLVFFGFIFIFLGLGYFQGTQLVIDALDVRATCKSVTYPVSCMVCIVFQEDKILATNCMCHFLSMGCIITLPPERQIFAGSLNRLKLNAQESLCDCTEQFLQKLNFDQAEENIANFENLRPILMSNTTGISIMVVF